MSEGFEKNDSIEDGFRCSECHKLLAKLMPGRHGNFEIKCPRCGTLNTILEQMISQVVVTDPEGTLLYLNKAAEVAAGFSSHEAIGKKIGDLWGNQMPREFYEDMWKTLREEKKTFTGKLMNRRKSGELYEVQLVVSPILDASGDVLFYVGIEILSHGPP